MQRGAWCGIYAVFGLNPTMQREALRPLTRCRGQRAYSNLENFHEVFWGTNCRVRADTLKLQSKLSNSAAEQTGLRDYMASKVDCKGVGIVGN